MCVRLFLCLNLRVNIDVLRAVLLLQVIDKVHLDIFQIEARQLQWVRLFCHNAVHNIVAHVGALNIGCVLNRPMLESTHDIVFVGHESVFDLLLEFEVDVLVLLIRYFA